MPASLVPSCQSCAAPSVSRLYLASAGSLAIISLLILLISFHESLMIGSSSLARPLMIAASQMIHQVAA